MTINLTSRAISMMCEHATQDGGKSAKLDIKPVLQVLDIKMVNTQQTAGNARYRVLLSDGLNTQQGMLATQKNGLVTSQVLRKGAIIELIEFVCNLIQGRTIVIIMDLKILLEACDPIGEPVPFISAIGGSALVGGTSMPTQPSVGRPVVGVSQQFPRTDQALGSSFSTNSESGRFAQRSPPPTRPKIESAAGNGGSVPLTTSYNVHNVGLPNNRVEVSRAPSSYVRPPQSAYQQQRPSMYTNRGPAAKPEDAPRIIPICALNPYQSKWTIKAKVTTKGDLREYTNARGRGKVFSFDLLDKDGGEIRVTSFNEAADLFFSQIHAGKIYYITNGSLKPAQKTYNHLHNEYEITLDRHSAIHECLEDDHSIPVQRFYFCNISDLEVMENNRVVDVIGVVTSITSSSMIQRKTGGETCKRSLQLKDMSGRNIELTLWGNFSIGEGRTLQELRDNGVYPVLAVKSARVNDFNGKALGTISTSQLFIDPPFLPNTRMLREWFDNEGRNAPSESLSKGSVGRTESRKVISQIKDEQLGTSEKPDWITVNATIAFIKSDNFCYPACPIMIGDRKCSKKVTNNGDGRWQCDRCNQEFDECEYRYILQLQIQDHTGLTWATAFQECGEEIIGRPARDLYEMKNELGDDEGFANAISEVMFTKYIFKLKVKEESYNDEQRVKSTIVKADKAKWDLESKHLMEMINKLKGESFGSTSFAPKVENIVLNTGLMNSSGFVSVRNTQASTPSIPGNREYGQMNQAGQYGREYGQMNQVGQYGREYGQAGQYGNQYTSSRVPASGPISCISCGGIGHSSASCPSVMTEPGNGGYVSSVPPANGSSGGTSGRYGGGFRQQVGGF